MPDMTLVKVSSKDFITLPKKIRTDLGIHDGDYLTISSGSTIISQKRKIEIDYDPDDVWKNNAKNRLARGPIRHRAPLSLWIFPILTKLDFY